MANGRQHTVCLTFDFDALSVWLGGYSAVTPAMLSRGEFGARVGVPRILTLLADYDIRATFFVPGHTAESFPHVVDAILTAEHEVAHHSYGHADPSTLSPDEERRSMEKAMRVLERFLGRAPRGYRSPSWDYSEVTLSLLWLTDGNPCQSEYNQLDSKLSGMKGRHDVVQPPAASIPGNR
jgi:peptidoglycan/xylan/chitin deacetylase (PgdA/CDA1 family)